MYPLNFLSHHETLFSEKLSDFKAFQLPSDLDTQSPIKIKRRHFTSLEDVLHKHTWNYYLPLSTNSKSPLFVNLNTLMEKQDITLLSNDDKLSCIHYINPNKQFFIANTCTSDEHAFLADCCNSIYKDSFLKNIRLEPSGYFDLIAKDWDIEYQIHELGFEHIDSLASLRQNLLTDESCYKDLLQNLLQNRKNRKDTYLIQLFNRLYLNLHSSPDPALLQRYLIPRYVDKTLYRNPNECSTFLEQLEELRTCLETCSEQDLPVLQSLQHYYTQFNEQFHSSPAPAA